VYAIVDIETTGGFQPQNRIIEVAVVTHDGERVGETYQRLINPMRFLPGFITGLTGITMDMLEEAPVFEEIAAELFDLLKDRVFVAHNVNFDLNFVKEEFKRAGYDYNPAKLCTVRLSRKLFPGYRSYSLGAICESRNIRIENRHRALGDAYATALLFDQLLNADSGGLVKASLRNKGREMSLPPHISKEKVKALPQAPGVYYFHDAKGQVIYVGKAVNINKRFRGHFVGKSKITLKSEIHDVTFQLTGNEFLALLLETLEIKRLWPKYNRSMKVKSNAWGIFGYEDQNGYQRLTINKINGQQAPLLGFSTHSEAWYFLMDKVKNFELCPKLCGIQKSNGPCYGLEGVPCKGACVGAETPDYYNERIEGVLEEIRMKGLRILVKEKGRNEAEDAAMLFEDGVLSAFGFVDRDWQIEGDVCDILTRVKPVMETRYLLRSYLERAKKSNVFLLPN
jgi:DNA polymerase-3 subunit epsilon